MNCIAKGLHISGTKYSQQTVEEGTKVFCNFLKRVEVDNYIKEQNELADGTNAFFDFIKKVRADVLRQSIEQRYAFIQPRRGPKVIKFLTIGSNSSLTQSQPQSQSQLQPQPQSQSQSQLQPQSQSQSQLQPQLQPQPQSQSQNFNTSDAIQHPQNNQQDQVSTYKFSRIFNGKQVQYLDKISLYLLEVLSKETPKIISNESEKSHIISNNELKALVIIVLCIKFNINNSNVKKLQKKIIDFDGNSEGKKISRFSYKMCCSLIYELIEKNIGRTYYICKNMDKFKLKKVDNFVLNELKVLDKLKNTDNKE